MNKSLILFSFFICSLSCFSQQKISVHYLDSLSSSIDLDHSQITRLLYDTTKSVVDSSVLIPIFLIKEKDGQISKIERSLEGECKSQMVYYFSNKTIFKIIAKLNCSGTTNWDNIIYYENGVGFHQIYQGNKLYEPAFKQEADALLSKFGK